MKKVYLFLIVLLLMGLIAACDTTREPRTGSFVADKEEVTFNYVCDSVHVVGMWLFARGRNVGSDSGTVAGFAVRMTEPEYMLYCVEMK